MNESEENKIFRTLRGFLEGEEPDEDNYFHFSATSRIHGDCIPFEEFNRELGVKPTHYHKKGERPDPKSPSYRDDAWHFQPSLSENEPLEHHIDELWKVIQPNIGYLKSLKEQFKVDVFCSYRSNYDHAGFEVSHTCLELFTKLEIPFEVSVVVV